MYDNVGFSTTTTKCSDTIDKPRYAYKRNEYITGSKGTDNMEMDGQWDVRVWGVNQYGRKKRLEKKEGDVGIVRKTRNGMGKKGEGYPSDMGSVIRGGICQVSMQDALKSGSQG